MVSQKSVSGNRRGEKDSRERQRVQNLADAVDIYFSGEKHVPSFLTRCCRRCDVISTMVIDQGTKPVEELQLLVDKHKIYITNLDKVSL